MEVERIKWNVVLANVVPDIFLRPIDQGIDLEEREALIPAHDGSIGSGRALLTPNRAEPGIKPLEALVEWNDFA